MQKIDFKKELKHLYKASAKTIEIVNVPRLNYLAVEGGGGPNSTDFQQAIEALYPVSYTLKFIAKKNFYSPLMNGDYGIKSIIKTIPDSSISYEEKGNIVGGVDAQLAWFVYTDPKTSNNEKEKQKDLLIEYCSKDTLAVYYLVKFLMKNC